ncbi:hypothetical protein KKG36_02775 [Patescibacteria group bacterium]|nr:hypothetical protein [Patescibacteria group bacterium]
MKGIEFKQDKYKKNRGGYSRLLEIKCQKCDNLIGIYQKDGPGQLKRLYIDRFFSPQNLVNLQKFSFKKISNLNCSKCGHVIGVPYIFKKESRPAFRLFAGVITKKVIKAK